MKYVLSLFLLLSAATGYAQHTIVESLETRQAGEGTVTVHEESYITSLIGLRNTGGAAQKTLKARGFRIQVYAGNNSRVARNEAQRIADKVKETFPEMPVYTYFQPPRWLCRVGDFKSIEEAHVAMRKLKGSGEFKEAAIVMIDTDLLSFPEEKVRKLMAHYKEILTLLGEDPEREGLVKTPERVAKAMLTLTRGYDVDPKEILLKAKFKEEYSQMVVVKDIDFFSMCEHHMLPFYGKAHVAYIPNGYITGLSKIARVVDVFSHRLQVQERMTLQIKECIQETLHPLGVMVVVEAKHMCMQMRGVEKQNSITTTSDFTGAFNQAKTREEFMNLIRK